MHSALCFPISAKGGSTTPPISYSVGEEEHFETTSTCSTSRTSNRRVWASPSAVESHRAWISSANDSARDKGTHEDDGGEKTGVIVDVDEEDDSGSARKGESSDSTVSWRRR
jgi:hypothetical protein